MSASCPKDSIKMSLPRRLMSSGYVGFQALKATSLTMLRFMGFEVISFANRMNSAILVAFCLGGSSSRMSWQDIFFVRATRSETSMPAKGTRKRQSERKTNRGITDNGQKKRVGWMQKKHRSVDAKGGRDGQTEV
ncbi:hypothetical protein SO802_002709 [Lithocarpus litseifolius]|uniref:Uncharacterized protein n=1 Tax=Lithocarpus litseifolius TaxID=425828 RepID=A0AAW2E247_9ROSI